MYGIQLIVFLLSLDPYTTYCNDSLSLLLHFKLNFNKIFQKDYVHGSPSGDPAFEGLRDIEFPTSTSPIRP